MKKILSGNKAAIILVVVTLLSTCFYAYMIARPVSYGMAYRTEMVYGTSLFEGTMTYHHGNKMVSTNSNFEGEMESYYYYKDGYVFSMMAGSEEEYAEEIAYINENFEDAVNTPFYASRINAFEQTVEGADGYATTYTCTPALIFAAAYGMLELILVGFTSASLMIRKKQK